MSGLERPDRWLGGTTDLRASGLKPRLQYGWPEFSNACVGLNSLGAFSFESVIAINPEHVKIMRSVQLPEIGWHI